MRIGPVFAREAITTPRRAGFYVTRTVFVVALFGLMITAWQVLFGAQQGVGLGDLATFGSTVFQILAPLQVAVALPFSALLAASAVAQEKDRRTLVLLLMTNLSNFELVVGKLLASMFSVLTVLIAALPLFMITALLGGVAHTQILRVFAVTVMSALVAGSLGSTVALWREKTFQALAVTALIMVLWLVGWEFVATHPVGDLAPETVRLVAVAMSPWQAIQEAARPGFHSTTNGLLGVHPATLFLLTSLGWTILLNFIAIVRVRVWNPSRQARPGTAEHEEGQLASPAAGATPKRDVHSAGGRVRPVWNNPILWREVRTWAYGKRILLIHFAYWTVFALTTAALVSIVAEQSGVTRSRAVIPPEAHPLAPLLVVSVILLNALAVTSLTNERDGRALDLLLVTDLSPKEMIFGKLGGAFYNAKEMILLPLGLCVYLWYAERLSLESMLFLVIGLLTMFAFAAMLGLHSAMTYANSRNAIATSIGTLLFLVLGVATCMRIMLAFSDSFREQLFTFLAMTFGGGVALYAALGLRNNSLALALAFIPAPFFTFFAMTSFLLQDYGVVFLVTTLVYGFATVAMLIPAVAEFDVATGRTVERPEG